MNIAKTRVVIFETICPLYKNLSSILNPDYFSIIAFVDHESAISSSFPFPLIPIEKLLDFSFWDMLLINDTACESQINQILNLLNIPENRYFFLKSTVQWNEISFYRTLFREDSIESMLIDFSSRKVGQNYLTITADGGDYITHASDSAISADMFLRKKVYSKNEIDLFIALTKQYYGTDESTNGFFLDIGANIGTTCIYAQKYLLPNISIIAFEPLYKNYKLLLANLILNDISNYLAINKAVSDRSSIYEMKFNIKNPGGSSIVERETNAPLSDAEPIESISIDEFLVQNLISPVDIRYVWIDTEGFECEVLRGAKSVLKLEKAAFYLEYSPCLVDIPKLISLADQCKQYFTKFICISDYFAGDTLPHPIDELYVLYKKHPVQTNIFLIK